jgi:hypothetical protein
VQEVCGGDSADARNGGGRKALAEVGSRVFSLSLVTVKQSIRHAIHEGSESKALNPLLRAAPVSVGEEPEPWLRFSGVRHGESVPNWERGLPTFHLERVRRGPTIIKVALHTIALHREPPPGVRVDNTIPQLGLARNRIVLRIGPEAFTLGWGLAEVSP